MTKILRVCFTEPDKSRCHIKQTPIYKSSHSSNKLFFARLRRVVRKGKLIQSTEINDNKVVNISKIKKR